MKCSFSVDYRVEARGKWRKTCSFKTEAAANEHRDYLLTKPFAKQVRVVRIERTVIWKGQASEEKQTLAALTIAKTNAEEIAPLASSLSKEESDALRAFLGTLPDARGEGITPGKSVAIARKNNESMVEAFPSMRMSSEYIRSIWVRGGC